MKESSPSRLKIGLEQILSDEHLSEILKDASVHEEIERKFLASSLPPDLGALEKEDIEQFYIPVNGDHEVRLRASSNGFYLTKKSGKGLVREETETAISKEMFDSLLPKAKSSLKKTRYKLPLKDGKVAELNLYGGSLNGLKVVEVEFDSLTAAEMFKPEDWFSSEVTYDNRYLNHVLASDGKPSQIGVGQGLLQARSRIEALLSVSDKPVVVLIAGGSASGKTSSVAKGLKDSFGTSATIIAMDDYYRGPKYIEAMKRSGIDMNFDQPEAVDLTALRDHLEKLLAGQKIDKPIYDFTDGPYKTETINPTRIIIVEGLFTLNPDIEKYGDVNIFVETSKHDRLIRKLLRDIERTTWSANQILDYTLGVCEPMYQRYIEPTKINADIIINNNYEPKTESKRASTLESQLKFRISHRPVENGERLRKIGAELIFRTEQLDTYYNTLSGDIVGRDELVRIRRESNRLTWTYKGPKDENNPLERRKLEVDSYESVIGGLSQIYKEVKRVKKTRYVYRLKGLVFSLDSDVTTRTGNEESKIGDFLEFRLSGQPGETELIEKVKETVDACGEEIRRSYFEM